MAVKKMVTAMDKVKLARDAKRPHLMDFIQYICSDFEELHGDRLVNDDRALIAGFATIDGVISTATHFMLETYKAGGVFDNPGDTRLEVS